MSCSWMPSVSCSLWAPARGPRPAIDSKLTDGTSAVVTGAMVEALEPIIDDVTDALEQPTEFVLPGENPVGAALDLARAVVRRAEARRRSRQRAAIGSSRRASSCRI